MQNKNEKISRHCGRGPVIQGCYKEKNTLLNRLDPGSMPGMTTRSAFTLIELLVVVLIIGILAAVAVPQYTRAVEKSRLAEAKIMLRQIANAQKVYHMANGSYATKLEDLGVDIPGTETNQVDRKETKYFRYGTCRHGENGICVYNTIAFASRLPYNTDYELWITADDDGIRCVELTGSVHKGFCKQESNGQKIGSFYVLTQ